MLRERGNFIDRYFDNETSHKESVGVYMDIQSVPIHEGNSCLSKTSRLRLNIVTDL